MRELHIILMSLLTMQVINSLLTFKHARIHKSLHFKSISRQIYVINNDLSKLEEIVIYNDLPLSYIPSTIHQIDSKLINLSITNPIWIVYRSSYLLDSIELPQDYYISGKNQLSQLETAEKWNKLTNTRLQSLIKQPISPSSTTITNNYYQHTRSIGYLNIELREALNAVKTASYISRSIQKQMNLTNKSHITNNSDNNSISKDDLSPVTIADFTVQAIVIDRLSHYFPTDKFIAEEDSSILQLASNEGVCNAILHAVTAATGEVRSIYINVYIYIVYMYMGDRINIPELLC